MGTRSTIAVKLGNGQFASIYCHYDGYVDHNGQLLQKHYQDEESVKNLIALGDISVLGKRVNPIGEHSFSEPEDGTTVAYGRDRGESDTEATISDYPMSNEFVYIYQDGEWSCNGTPLKELL